ncbi:50S ribosomal protein L14 [Patescibacteria group bacterium]|nr:50S ribosomal protein L14 [Patescibacteria group bacterium]MBU4023524.1 50S ribosomal protein L14 [Patescibacteria group bacterium]MBU4078016.1 50S ribosomal protein L14 [Patescibacteria group bacterium]
MIQDQTMLNVADNSGAKIVQCFKVLGGSKRRYAQLGDIIVVAVKKADTRKEVKKHDKTRAVIVRQKKAYRRKDGSYIRFDDNAVVILDGNTKNPRGSRIFGPIPKEIKEAGYSAITNLAREII